jgi:hypothetical protein
MAVISAHEMRLRSTSHPSHVLDSFHRHGGILAFSNQLSAFSNQPNLFTAKNAKDAKESRYFACRILCDHCALCG